RRLFLGRGALGAEWLRKLINLSGRRFEFVADGNDATFHYAAHDAQDVAILLRNRLQNLPVVGQVVLFHRSDLASSVCLLDSEHDLGSNPYRFAYPGLLCEAI